MPGGARMAKSVRFWTIVAAIAGVVGVTWAVVTFVVADEPTEASQSQSGTQGATINGNGNVVNNLQNFYEQLPPDASDEEIRRTAEKFRDKAPQGTAPYPYLVVDVGDEGLMVRSTGDKTGRQTGTAAKYATIWVECRQDTGFDPGANVPNGSQWLKVRWPSQEETRAFLKSQPSDPPVGWAYSGYAVPAGHNGNIPEC
jgi:hypothetical protein